MATRRSLAHSKVEKGWLGRITQADEFLFDEYPFMYNPTNFSRDQSPVWAPVESAGILVPGAVFSHMGPDQYRFELFLHCLGLYDEQKQGLNAELMKLERVCITPNWDDENYEDQILDFTPPATLWMWLGYPPEIIPVKCTQFQPRIEMQNNALHPMLARVSLAFERTYIDVDTEKEYARMVMEWSKKWV